MSYQHFRSYSDVKVLKALNIKETRNANVSQTMAVSKHSLVSFGSASKVVKVYEHMSLKLQKENKIGTQSDPKRLPLVNALGQAHQKIHNSVPAVHDVNSCKHDLCWNVLDCTS